MGKEIALSPKELRSPLKNAKLDTALGLGVLKELFNRLGRGRFHTANP